MLIFDKINYTVSHHRSTLKLQPLSFRLLETLASAPNQIISVETLIETVWGSVTVSPETLKQRVFILRKAIEESGLTGLSIQAIRGEGYRLCIEAPQTAVIEPAKWRPRRWSFTVAATVMIVFALVMLAAMVFKPPAPVIYNNNRVVLWSNMPADKMPAEALDSYETWRSLLTSDQPARNFQVIFSELQQDMPMPVQARKNRAALISLFEVVHQQDMVSVRLSIIEGSTATVLRSELFTEPDPTNRQSMENQIAGIQALIASGELSLANAQRENAEAPLWQTLKVLAQQNSTQ